MHLIAESREGSSISSVFNCSIKNSRKILKAFLLGQLYEVFCELFHVQIQNRQVNSSMECYAMDSKLIQVMIEGIEDS